MATSMRSRIIRDFQTQLYNTCGVRSLVLTSFADEQQRIRAAM